MPPYREKPLPERLRQEPVSVFPSREPASVRMHQGAHHTGAPVTLDRPGHTVLCRGPWIRLKDWSLVLHSQHIPHHFAQGLDGPWYLEVLDSRAEEAALQLRLYREENPDKPAYAPLPPLRWSAQPLWVLAIPVAFSYWQFSHPGAFQRAGIADADLIGQGEWWRAFTALTLHADTGHLASNLVSGFLVLALLSLRLPLTRLVPQLIGAAGLANMGVAWLIGSDFRSLGFSTFVFAALGALGTVEWRLLPAGEGLVLRRFAPWLGVLMLSVLLGLGENADILAHFFGLGAGLLAGFLPSRRRLQWGSPFTLADGTMALGCYGFFALVWLKALGRLPLWG